MLIDHLGLGGAELLLAHTARVAPSVQIRMSVAALKHANNDLAERNLQAAGVVPTILAAPERIGPRALREVSAHVRSVDPDIVHTHLGTSDLLGTLAARLLGIPAVCSIHATMAWIKSGVRERARAALVARARRHCAAHIVAVSDSARLAYLARGWDTPDRITTIHNGIDVSPAPGSGRSVREELGLEADSFVVGMVSALRHEKGHDLAVAALESLRDEFPHLRLLIVGMGPAHDTIARLARPLGDRVVFAGPRSDVMSVFDAIDVCVHPSRSDAFPTTLLEAMAASVPVVASAVGGIPEIIEAGRQGVLVPAPPRAADLAEAIRGMVRDPERRRELAREGKRRYESRFTAAVSMARTRELYEEVLSEAPASRKLLSRARARGSLSIREQS